MMFNDKQLTADLNEFMDQLLSMDYDENNSTFSLSSLVDQFNGHYETETTPKMLKFAIESRPSQFHIIDVLFNGCISDAIIEMR